MEAALLAHKLQCKVMRAQIGMLQEAHELLQHITARQCVSSKPTWDVDVPAMKCSLQKQDMIGCRMENPS